MKYILLVGDGMADRPIKELNNKTVLEVANTTFMDKVVASGAIGLVTTIPPGMTPGSDVAALSILGYDPRVYYKGRGPLEAANLGVTLGANEVAFRCNTVTVSDNKMVDYSAGHIKTKESQILINELEKQLGSETVRFYPGISYRHLMVMKAASQKEADGLCKVKCTPPHDIAGKDITKYLPHGKSAGGIMDLMERSKKVFENHDVNKVRIDLAENPATMAWFWGQGVHPAMQLFKEVFGVAGAVISAVDLINGIGKLTWLDIVKVPGVTGYYDTNFKGKADFALDALKNKDFVFVHVEAPDEAGHNGDVRAKITAIENFDRLVVGTIWEEIKDRSDFRLMVLPDHATPVSVKSHTDEPVPFAVCGKDIAAGKARAFNEIAARESEFSLTHGWQLMRYLINLDEGKK
ncbi:MAG: cofactor-independent phosphoglycerate mutase [Candidatus Omnitrophica bacterium]|nr:cofactor-independent phosphoglycerate mutase [Candidatus Omnitrophota bacterium]